MTEDDWSSMKNDIIVVFARDNYFSELKESEILRERLQTLDQVSNYIGTYFSQAWVQKNVLKFTDDEIKNMNLPADGEQGDENE